MRRHHLKHLTLATFEMQWVRVNSHQTSCKASSSLFVHLKYCIKSQLGDLRDLRHKHLSPQLWITEKYII